MGINNGIKNKIGNKLVCSDSVIGQSGSQIFSQSERALCAHRKYSEMLKGLILYGLKNSAPAVKFHFMCKNVPFRS